MYSFFILPLYALINFLYIQQLHALCITLIHKVPPQHKIELTGSREPTRQEKKLFQRHGPLRYGSYTPLEDKIIMKN